MVTRFKERLMATKTTPGAEFLGIKLNGNQTPEEKLESAIEKKCQFGSITRQQFQA